MITTFEFFSSSGMMTSPAGYVNLLDDLPGEIGSLCQVVQGLVIHIFWAEHYGVQLSGPRRDEVQIRSFTNKLERIIELDPRPLTEVRKPDQRLVGNCRDFSLMLTAILRYQGIPARARCGFGRYFGPDHYEDHWVCEYWNATQAGWVLVDAQLDELQRNILKIEFNPLDVPRDAFIVGGKAWQLCRLGQADPETFGIFDMHGMWFVRGDMLRDVASLNKIELLPWDSWGAIEAHDEDLSAEDLTLLDQVAEWTSSDVPEFDHLRHLYENDDRLRVPKTIRSYTQAGVQVINL